MKISKIVVKRLIRESISESMFKWGKSKSKTKSKNATGDQVDDFDKALTQDEEDIDLDISDAPELDQDIMPVNRRNFIKGAAALGAASTIGSNMDLGFDEADDEIPDKTDIIPRQKFNPDSRIFFGNTLSLSDIIYEYSDTFEPDDYSTFEIDPEYGGRNDAMEWNLDNGSMINIYYRETDGEAPFMSIAGFTKNKETRMHEVMYDNDGKYGHGLKFGADNAHEIIDILENILKYNGLPVSSSASVMRNTQKIVKGTIRQNKNMWSDAARIISSCYSDRKISSLKDILGFNYSSSKENRGFDELKKSLGYMSSIYHVDDWETAYPPVNLPNIHQDIRWGMFNRKQVIYFKSLTGVEYIVFLPDEADLGSESLQEGRYTGKLINEAYSEVLTEIFNTTDIYPFKKIQDQLRESTSIDQLEKFKQDMIQSYKQIIRLNRKDHSYIAMEALKDLEELMRMNEFQLNQFFKQESGFRDDLETFSGHQTISNGHDSDDYFASQISNTVNSVVLKFGPKQLQSIVNEIYASNPSDPQIPITDDYGKIVFYFKIPTDISNNIEIFLERLVLILEYELVDMLGQVPINEAMTLLVAYCEVNDYELDGLYAYEYEAQLNKSLKISSAKQKQDTYNCLKSREIPEFADFIEPHLSKGLSIIKEEYSLNEIFNTTDIYPFEQRTFNGHNDNKEYAFTTKDNLFYKVGFRFTNGAFSIDFYVDDMHVDGYAMTNKLDFKVYSTVAAIARYYDETTNASIAKVYTFDANAEFPGDKRRERAYIYILEKNGFHVYYDNYGDVCFKSVRNKTGKQNENI